MLLNYYQLSSAIYFNLTAVLLLATCIKKVWLACVVTGYLWVAISDFEISLVFPWSMTPLGMNVKLSGDSSPRALSHGVCYVIVD